MNNLPEKKVSDCTCGHAFNRHKFGAETHCLESRCKCEIYEEGVAPKKSWEDELRRLEGVLSILIHKTPMDEDTIDLWRQANEYLFDLHNSLGTNALIPVAFNDVVKVLLNVQNSSRADERDRIINRLQMFAIKLGNPEMISVIKRVIEQITEVKP
jgi:hypothetical protein